MDKIIFRIITLLLIIDSIILGLTAIKVIKKNNQPLAATVLATSTDATDIIPENEYATVLNSEASTEITTEATLEEFTISMNFVGDLLLATNHAQTYENCFNQVADEQPPEYFLQNVSEIFLNDDITVGDCENVFSDSDSLYISDKGQAQAEADYAAACAAAEAAGEPMPEDTFQAFWFKSKAANASIIKVGGIDIVSIDNNHINDYGQQGKEDTKLALEAAGVEWGNSTKTVYREVNGFRIAFIFGTMYGPGAESTMLSNLNAAQSESDYQVVYFHGGTESIHEPEGWKVASCHNLVDNGADLILGDHPHVLQPMEEYNGVYIVYSLGNLCFGGNKHPENRTIIFNQTLNITKDIPSGTYTITNISYDITPCYVYTGDINNWQPAIIDDEADKQKVLDFMNGLTSSPL